MHLLCKISCIFKRHPIHSLCHSVSFCDGGDGDGVLDTDPQFHSYLFGSFVYTFLTVGTSSVIVQYLYSACIFFFLPSLESLILNYTKYTLYLFVVASQSWLLQMYSNTLTTAAATVLPPPAPSSEMLCCRCWPRWIFFFRMARESCSRRGGNERK